MVHHRDSYFNFRAQLISTISRVAVLIQPKNVCQHDLDVLPTKWMVHHNFPNALETLELKSSRNIEEENDFELQHLWQECVSLPCSHL